MADEYLITKRTKCPGGHKIAVKGVWVIARCDLTACSGYIETQVPLTQVLMNDPMIRNEIRKIVDSEIFEWDTLTNAIMLCDQ